MSFIGVFSFQEILSKITPATLLLQLPVLGNLASILASLIFQCKMVQKHKNVNWFLSFNYTKFAQGMHHPNLFSISISVLRRNANALIYSCQVWKASLVFRINATVDAVLILRLISG